MTKTATIESNDPQTPRLRLTLSGEVNSFARVEPSRVSLAGVAGETIDEQVTITPVAAYPFKVLESKALKGDYIDHRLAEKQSGGAVFYELTVTNLKDEAGHYSDTIIIKTDSEIRPELRINVRGNLRAPAETTGSPDKPKAAASE